jgi:hypothetical protein
MINKDFCERILLFQDTYRFENKRGNLLKIKINVGYHHHRKGGFFMFVVKCKKYHLLRGDIIMVK